MQYAEKYSIDLLEKGADKKKEQTQKERKRENLADLELGQDRVLDS